MVKRTERGWRVSCSKPLKCMFNRNTLVECGEKRFVVSTIGARISDDGKWIIPLTYRNNNYYKTKVFCAQKRDSTWEEGSEFQYEFANPTRLKIIAREAPYEHKYDYDHTYDIEANNMHDSIVEELSGMM